MTSELSPLAASLLSRPLVSNSELGTPCPICKGLTGQGILSSPTFCWDSSPSASCTVHLVEADAMSDKAFGQVARWMNHCAAHHGGCIRLDTNFMPTRLLDVGQDDAQHVRLVLGVSPGKFAALSHCWGTSRHIVTGKATLHEFDVSLDMARLPPNFADAVRFTRRLGIQYLWIDSLCIIQGDE